MKRFLTKQTVTAFLFLLIVGATGLITAIQNAGAFYRAVFFQPSLTGVMESVIRIYSDSLFGSNIYIDIYSIVSAQTYTDLFEDIRYGYIIRDTHNKLHFTADHCFPEMCAQKYAAFSSEIDTPLLYVQAPNKKLEGYTVFPTGAYNYSNEDADTFLSLISAEGLKTLDLRDNIIEQDIDRDSLFYSTDHHWTAPAAFWAFGEVTERLNELFDLGIDRNGFFRDITNYGVLKKEQCFLGTQGRRIGRFAAGLDDYTLIYPNFETDYKIYNANDSVETPIWEGPFMDTIVRKNVFESKNIEENFHASYFQWDHGHLIIRNEKCDNGKKILLVKDSFSLPFAAFLSTSVSELHMYDLRETANLYTPAELCEIYDYDAVIVLYNTETFFDPMFDLG